MDKNIKLQQVTPIFRIFDIDKAKEFYIDFLSFHLDWEHKFQENYPLYIQISFDGCIVHLSEHHGDCSPGAAIRIEVQGIKELYSSLVAKNYKYAKPSIETTPWNTLEVQVTDPFGNKITFYENKP